MQQQPQYQAEANIRCPTCGDKVPSGCLECPRSGCSTNIEIHPGEKKVWKSYQSLIEELAELGISDDIEMVDADPAQPGGFKSKAARDRKAPHKLLTKIIMRYQSLMKYIIII